jgi:hypothetical protein
VVDYDFYVHTFLGSLVPEKAFNRLAARASEHLSSFERDFQVTGGTDARRFALCAMAEVLYAGQHRGEVRSASVNGVQVSYDDRRPMQKRLLAAVRTYLDVYRGVS